MDKIARSRLKPFVKTFQDINIDFLAVERPIFMFKQMNDIQRTFNNDSREREKYATQLADQLYTFFLTAGFAPYIRYSADSSISKSVASKVYDLVNKTKGLTKDKSIALIVDRTEDVYAPLLHEFTYQAMTYDLVHVSPNVSLKSDDELTPSPIGQCLSIFIYIRRQSKEEQESSFG